jgi:acyl-coenzyme A thioesterase PaaI-like protein
MTELTAVLGTGFSTVSAVRPVGGGRFEADVHPDWSIVRRPNGGYLLAVLARAATAPSSPATSGPAVPAVHPHVIAASAHYLRSPSPGPVVVDVEPLRVGRGTSQVRARMSQGGQACVEALLTTARLGEVATFWDDGVPDPVARSVSGEPGSGVRVPPVAPDGSPVPIMRQVEVELDRDHAGFLAGRPSGRGMLRGWLTLPDGEAFDPASLLFAVDAFPPSTFDVEFAGWVPTLELTAYVRALPAPGPVRVLQRARLIAGQRVDQACTVWDVTGRLVAQATQLAAVRLG